MIIVILLGPARLGAWTPERWFERPRSPRIANYKIEAALDWKEKVLTGQETLTWRNAGTAATAELPLHLYLNAFKGPQSLFFKEKGRAAGPGPGGWDAADARHWGYCRLLSVRLENRPLDGHFGEDETVYWVRLPRAGGAGRDHPAGGRLGEPLPHGPRPHRLEPGLPHGRPSGSPRPGSTRATGGTAAPTMPARASSPTSAPTTWICPCPTPCCWPTPAPCRTSGRPEDITPGPQAPGPTSSGNSTPRTCTTSPGR